MEQTRALNALEPFVALSKSANSPRAAADLVTQATSAPNTYVFAELLQTPNIQALRKSEEYAPSLTLLEIFAWGTWADYKCERIPERRDRLDSRPLRLISFQQTHRYQNSVQPSNRSFSFSHYYHWLVLTVHLHIITS